MTRKLFDVGVIGGGPAGSATAILLARAGIRVLLLEMSDYSGFRVGETLPPLIDNQLRRLGVLKPFAQQEHRLAAGIVSVWGSTEPHVNDFLSGVHGSGWQIDRASFDRMLAASAEKAGATVRLGSRMLSSPRWSRETWDFEFACRGRRSECSCRFLVDATGRSGTSSLSHLSPRIVLDKLIGVIWRGKQNGEWPYTLVESVDDGWFYAANLPGEQVIVAYLTDSDLYRQGSKRCAHHWRRQLSKTTRACKRVPRAANFSKLRIISAASSARLKPAGKGWCAVGDAAISYDPLSGLGVYNALESALQAAPAIEQYLQDDQPLDSYRRWVARKGAGYLTARQYHYATEQRWPSSLFWQRRASPSCATA